MGGIGCRPGALLSWRASRSAQRERWQGHVDMHYEKKTSGPSPQGRQLCRFKFGDSRAGNDCDAFCSAMEQGQDGPRKTVVDFKWGGAVKEAAGKRGNSWEIAGGTCTLGRLR